MRFLLLKDSLRSPQFLLRIITVGRLNKCVRFFNYFALCFSSKRFEIPSTMCSNEEQTARTQNEPFNIFFTFKSKTDNNAVNDDALSEGKMKMGTSQRSGAEMGSHVSSLGTQNNTPMGAHKEKLKALSTVFSEGTLCFSFFSLQRTMVLYLLEVFRIMDFFNFCDFVQMF